MACLARQHEEDGLKSILRIGSIVENPTANAEHHPPVAMDQHGESVLVSGREATKQVEIGLLISGLAKRAA